MKHTQQKAGNRNCTKRNTMRKTITAAALALMAATATAQEKKSSWTDHIKASGFVTTQYQYTGKEGAEGNSFGMRFFRLTLDGRIGRDFYWKTQAQLNGNTSSLSLSPRMVDMFVEWQRLPSMCVKVGQFKRPFSFENPLHPIDQGFMGYSQAVMALAGFSDRTGEHSSNGRDIGVQLQGDLLKNAAGRPLLHYQAGVFNGQGINTGDVDQRKDIIGGFWIMPVKGMRIGAFGWEGSYARKGTWTEDGVQRSGVRSLPRHRYAISADYATAGWTFRAEYIHSTGKAFSKTLQDADGPEASDCTLSAKNAKADGWYAAVIAPIVEGKLYAKARYDTYRNQADWASAHTNYEAGLNWIPCKGIHTSIEYVRVNDRTAAQHNYDMVDAQLSFRF